MPLNHNHDLTGLYIRYGDIDRVRELLPVLEDKLRQYKRKPAARGVRSRVGAKAVPPSQINVAAFLRWVGSIGKRDGGALRMVAKYVKTIYDRDGAPTPAPIEKEPVRKTAKAPVKRKTAAKRTTTKK